jgi:hypothetical protein
VAGDAVAVFVPVVVGELAAITGKIGASSAGSTIPAPVK